MKAKNRKIINIRDWNEHNTARNQGVLIQRYLARMESSKKMESGENIVVPGGFFKLEITINVDAIVRRLGLKAVSRKSGRALLAEGGIELRLLPQRD
jgi:hypothetical protein